MTRQDPVFQKHISLGGKIGTLCKKITERWLIGIRETNPAILDTIRDADKKPLRVLLPWSGEFPGKYLTGASEIYSMTHDEALGEYIQSFIYDFISLQQADGYIGPLPAGYHFCKHSPEMNYDFEISEPKHELMWDAWGHYHAMTALMLWYEISGDEKSLTAACRIGDLFCRTFYTENEKKLSDIGTPETNMSPIHSMARLYQITNDRKYLDFALNVAEDLSSPTAGNYIKAALCGTEFYQMPLPRWESLHAIEGIATLYEITEEKDYFAAFKSLWQSMTKTDIHNTGGFTTGEKAQGDPFRFGAIETCCTIAYMALTRDYLRISGESVAADMLEWCTYNTGIGAFSPSGRWSTYDTPMEGFKRANYHTIGFQSRPGAPDLNCCSVNAPRAIGLLTDWAYTTVGNCLCINFYGENTASLTVNGKEIKIEQITNYPYDGKIALRFYGITGKEKIKLRIPFWSENTKLFTDGKTYIPSPGYFEIEREWHDGDQILLFLDMTPRFQAGEGRLSDKACVFAGPLLLCFDAAVDRETSFDPLPEISAESFEITDIDMTSTYGALYKCRAANGKILTLCDLYTAGVSGMPYTTWLSYPNCTPVPFSINNPSRTFKK